MQIINTEGIEPLHIWVITSYNPMKWNTVDVILEHYNFDSKSPWNKEYITPLKGIRVDGNPYQRLSRLMLLLQQKSLNDGPFYLIECEIPFNFVNEQVEMPYLVRNWIRGITFLNKVADNGAKYFKYQCKVMYENEYGALLYNTSVVEYEQNNLQEIVDRVNVMRDPEMSFLYSVTSIDLLKSMLVRCKDFEEGSAEFNKFADYIASDINLGNFPAFSGLRKDQIDTYLLSSYKYLWECSIGVDDGRYSIDFDNLSDSVRNANKVLKEKRLAEEKAKEKERIRREKEEIARKKRYYGPNADKVDDRVKQDQNSLGWWARWAASKVTFGLIRPPKTIRSDDYREQFMKRNPGLFVDGFYLCIYCGKPIRAKSQNKNWKMYVDHIKPINQGGRNSTWNLGPACMSCNLAKSDKGGEWVLRGYIGKAGYTTLQTISNITKTLFLGFKEKSRLKRAASIAFYGVTGLWLLTLFL